MDDLKELKEADLMDYKDTKHLFPDDRPDWDSWFMGMCCLAATRSRDTSTAHGAVVCDSNHRLLGIGYNGFPRNCDDSVFSLERPAKYDVTIHAEENCLLNSQGLLTGNNYTMYVTGTPCSRCFIKIMQFNVERVVYGNITSHCVDKQHINLVRELAEMRQIQLNYLNNFDCQKNIDIFKGILSRSS